MLFNKRFKVIEMRDDGASVINYLHGSRKDVRKDIELYKKNAKQYEMIGKDGMVIWV